MASSTLRIFCAFILLYIILVSIGCSLVPNGRGSYEVAWGPAPLEDKLLREVTRQDDNDAESAKKVEKYLTKNPDLITTLYSINKDWSRSRKSEGNSDDGSMLVYMALEYNNFEVAEVLLKYGAKLTLNNNSRFAEYNVSTQNLFGLLEDAFEKENIKKIELLLKFYAATGNAHILDTSRLISMGHPIILDTIMKTNKKELFALWLQGRKRPFPLTEFRVNLMTYVVRNDWVDIAEYLIDNGYPVNQESINYNSGVSQTALTLAKSDEMRQLLLKKGGVSLTKGPAKFDVERAKKIPVLGRAIGFFDEMSKTPLNNDYSAASSSSNTSSGSSTSSSQPTPASWKIIKQERYSENSNKLYIKFDGDSEHYYVYHDHKNAEYFTYGGISGITMSKDEIFYSLEAAVKHLWEKYHK